MKLWDKITENEIWLDTKPNTAHTKRAVPSKVITEHVRRVK